MTKICVGISGWTFDGWKKKFYPEDLPARRQLEFASRQLNSIEINGTFYSLQKPKSFQSWYSETPEDFTFSVKAPQYMTHVLRLKEIEEPLANFLASGLLCLKDKLGPILWQFPPNVMLKDDRFAKFLSLLPKSMKEASKVAKKHGAKVEGRSYTQADVDGPMRHAFEFRHPSFLTEEFVALLAKHGVAFVLAHEAGEKAPYLEEPTADFVYLRMHGQAKKYARGYPDAEIAKWADRIEAWKKEKRDAFVYFSTDAKVYSPASAMKLTRALGIKRPLSVKKAA